MIHIDVDCLFVENFTVAVYRFAFCVRWNVVNRDQIEDDLISQIQEQVRSTKQTSALK